MAWLSSVAVAFNCGFQTAPARRPNGGWVVRAVESARISTIGVPFGKSNTRGTSKHLVPSQSTCLWLAHGQKLRRLILVGRDAIRRNHPVPRDPRDTPSRAIHPRQCQGLRTTRQGRTSASSLQNKQAFGALPQSTQCRLKRGRCSPTVKTSETWMPPKSWGSRAARKILKRLFDAGGH